ncbi:MAG: sodium:solute symporter [Candidatus Marinimicrobia bacterium]|nr:sodium:solute symporter [Candidatus Neomarinimicrobiota bacterium]MCF7830029.1 sodium:solute symporter [Candidatus Neomarinimicrobiota bacterium]MCF7881929.1 sodium:solute symporter [Candidatus Neomarinimicrobiota bacterium]
MGLTSVDYIVIVVYLAGVAVAGILAAGRQKSTSDYFLGGHRIPWWAVLFSVVATETSTLTFISVPAVAYGGNMTFLQITLGYIAGRITVALIFLPRYYEGELSTAYQFLGKRFGDSMRNITSSTFMVTRLLADGVRLFATAIPLAVILRMGGGFAGLTDLQIYLLSIIAIAGVTMVYTFIGGIKAVVWMDVIQMTVYIGGALIAVGIILTHLPNGLRSALSLAGESGKLETIRFGFDMSFREFIATPYTFFTALIGGGIFSVASHGTDQLIVQRLLTTRDLRNSQKALIGSGFVILFQFALFLFIGILLYGFYDGQSVAQLGLTNTDEIFAKFIVEELPIGLSGLIVAALFAAAMSSLSSSLNSLASATTLDLYKPYFGKDDSPEKELKISRFITIIWGLILTGAAFLFAVIQLGAEGEQPAVVELGLSIASYTYGGLLGAFALGILFKRPERLDAVVGFFAGLVTLLFLVKGPVQNLLPGEGLAIAWPLYTVVGSLVVVLVGNASRIIREQMLKREENIEP